ARSPHRASVLLLHLTCHFCGLLHPPSLYLCFFFTDPATTELYPLSLHDALPICSRTRRSSPSLIRPKRSPNCWIGWAMIASGWRSEEHTSELQSLTNLVCRLLLEKKNTQRG